MFNTQLKIYLGKKKYLERVKHQNYKELEKGINAIQPKF